MTTMRKSVLILLEYEPLEGKETQLNVTSHNFYEMVCALARLHLGGVATVAETRWEAARLRDKYTKEAV